MTNLWVKAPLIAFAFVALSGVFNEARALENCTGKCPDGYKACIGWCDAHNKTEKNLRTCHIRCSDYWLSGKNPQSIGPADPRKSPAGPAQVNPPPKAQ